MSDHIAFRWVIALTPEALAIRERYRMISFPHNGPYPVFKDTEGLHWLTVCGVGRINAAAATIYLQQVSKAPPWSAWINVGIAGKREDTYGNLYHIDKITEDSTGQRYYPSPAITSSPIQASLVTVDKPETNYDSNDLFDMEGSAFFDLACRLSCQQLVMLLKIVSDGPEHILSNLNKNKIADLVSRNIDNISNIVSQMNYAIEQEYSRLKVPDIYHLILTKWHFTQTQKYQLNLLVKRCQAINPDLEMLPYLKDCHDAMSALQKLSIKLDDHQIDWGKL